MVGLEGNLAQVKNGSRPLARRGQERGAGSQDTGAATQRRRRVVPPAPHPVGGRDRKWRWAAHASQPIASPLIPTLPSISPPPLPIVPEVQPKMTGAIIEGVSSVRKKNRKWANKKRFDYRGADEGEVGGISQSSQG